MSNRLVRKYFKCHKCKDFESQLIHPNKFQIKCQSCGAFLNEISEKEFKVLKKSKNQNNEQKTNNDAPYMPSENAFRNISSVYNRPPSRTNHPNQSQNSNNINFINRNRFNNEKIRKNDFSNENFNSEIINNNTNIEAKIEETPYGFKYKDTKIVTNVQNYKDNLKNNEKIETSTNKTKLLKNKHFKYITLIIFNS